MLLLRKLLNWLDQSATYAFEEALSARVIGPLKPSSSIVSTHEESQRLSKMKQTISLIPNLPSILRLSGHPNLIILYQY